MSFAEAYAYTLGKEGGYSHDPDDLGGETYKGISRKFHPHWIGWPLIDSMDHVDSDPTLDKMASEFYRVQFWDKLLGSLVAEISDPVAGELFDTAVNMSPRRAVGFLQESLNALNRNGKLYPDLVEDGKIGRITLAALRALPRKDHATLLKMMNVLQGAYYMDRFKASPIQEKFARGWFSRVEITRQGQGEPR